MSLRGTKQPTVMRGLLREEHPRNDMCKAQLWEWKGALIERLARLRLVIHEPEAQVMPVSAGIPWLGFVVYPEHRRIKSRNVVKFSRRLRERWGEYTRGQISFAEFDASVQGWINHVRYADTWGLRKHILGKPLVGKKIFKIRGPP